MMQDMSVVPFARIASAIWIVRGEKVMLDADLAALYGVETKLFETGRYAESKKVPARLYVYP